MARVRVGTASWTDRSLVESGSYYPHWAKTAEDRLRFYASEFPVVEVDSSYYGLPSERNSALWVERTPSDFVFNFKAFRLFTGHPTPPSAFPKDLRQELPQAVLDKRNLYYSETPSAVRAELWKMFESALLPLDSAGKLGVVVFQFPPWFMPNSISRNHILECKEHLPQYRIAVEFRNAYWLSDRNRDSTFAFLRSNGLSFVAVDEPQGFKTSVPPVAEVTGEFAIVRFHGRNRETWEKRGLASSSERFNYYYSEEEVREWIPRVQRMRDEASEVHLVMNTNYQDQGIANARLMARLLGEGTTQPADNSDV